MWAYILANLIAIDQLANTLLAGSPDETLSARAWRTEQAGKRFGGIFRPLIDMLFFWQPNHCQAAWLSEVRRTQYPKNYR